MSNLPPQRTASQHIEAFRQLLVDATLPARISLNAFWKDVRKSLNDQDTTIQQLRQQIQNQAQAPNIIPQTPARPTTSNSVNVIRDTIDQAILNEALYMQDVSDTLEEICDLDPIWVSAFLRRQKNIHISNANELGCWLSGNAAGHINGYIKINMRGTTKPNSNEKFKVQPWAHQLGVVANGSGAVLRLTSDGTYHVSFLTVSFESYSDELY